MIAHDHQDKLSPCESTNDCGGDSTFIDIGSGTDTDNHDVAKNDDAEGSRNVEVILVEILFAGIIKFN